MKRLASNEALQSESKRVSNKAENQELVKFYFKLKDGSDEKYVCRCGKERSQKANTGWSNLVSHVHTDHLNWKQEIVDGRNSISSFLFMPSEKAKQIYGWLDLIITEGYDLT
jgi:hypothetical protein